MILDLDFIIAASIIILFIIPLYIYKEKVFKFFYKKDDFATFLIEVTNYLKVNHPKIKFDYDFINSMPKEENPKVKEMIVVERFISQFIDYEYYPKTQATLPSERLWENYQQNSKPIKSKLPNDWSRRKDYTWQRDDKRCKRCGIKLKMDDAQIYFLKNIEDGGTFHFENLLTLCFDCNKILNSNEKLKNSKYLNISENLMNKVVN